MVNKNYKPKVLLSFNVVMQIFLFLLRWISKHSVHESNICSLRQTGATIYFFLLMLRLEKSLPSYFIFSPKNDLLPS